jgi:hypothetical protein
VNSETPAITGRSGRRPGGGRTPRLPIVAFDLRRFGALPR